jgi:hypothetical protein
LIQTWRALLIRPAALPLWVLCLTLPPAAAFAVTLTDVRIGVHPDYTRVVLETDAKAPYIVDTGEREIVVHVDAAAAAEAVTAKSPHLIWAKVEPTPIGADVRLQLKQPIDVKAMVLSSPNRIVLDLYPKKGVAQPLPAPELLPEQEPAVTAEAPPEARPMVEEPTQAELDEFASGELSAEDLADDVAAGAELAPLANAEPAPEATGAEPGVETGGASETEMEAPPAPSAPTVEELAAEPTPAEAEAPAAEAAAQAAPEPTPPTTPLAPAPSGSRFGSPYALAAAALALLLVFLFLRRRLRGGDKAAPLLRDMDGTEPFPPLQRAVVDEGAPASPQSLFDVEAEALVAPPKDDDSLPQLRQPQREPVDETDRRIGQLERRIEELVDARERLERQVAAQTEELRVQRAAIARTQRVLRSVAPRGDDEPSSDPVK